MELTFLSDEVGLSIGARLAAARARERLTIRAVAEVTGFHPLSVNRVELFAAGEHLPSLSTVYRLCAAYGEDARAVLPRLAAAFRPAPLVSGLEWDCPDPDGEAGEQRLGVTVSRRLRAVREARGLTQRDAAAALGGLTPQAVSRTERLGGGTGPLTLPLLETVYRLCAAYQIEPAEVLPGTTEVMAGVDLDGFRGRKPGSGGKPGRPRKKRVPPTLPPP